MAEVGYNFFGSHVEMDIVTADSVCLFIELIKNN